MMYAVILLFLVFMGAQPVCAMDRPCRERLLLQQVLLSQAFLAENPDPIDPIYYVGINCAPMLHKYGQNPKQDILLETVALDGAIRRVHKGGYISKKYRNGEIKVKVSMFTSPSILFNRINRRPEVIEVDDDPML